MTTEVVHPAPFSPKVLESIERWVRPGTRWLDPFAGIGRIHTLRPTVETWGVELEPEWASTSPYTIVGNAKALPFPDGSFDGVVTSPVYGNRASDHHDAQERCKPCGATGMVGDETCEKCEGKGRRAYRRITYRHSIGRPLHPENAGRMQWGRAYRDLHGVAWAEALRVLRPGGALLLNISDHVRAGEVQEVSTWHLRTLEGLGMRAVELEPIHTPRMRYGQNRDRRVDHEWLIVMVLP